MAEREENDMFNREVVYGREHLYKEVWAEPVEKIAKRYGVSCVALAKTCRKLAVMALGP